MNRYKEYTTFIKEQQRTCEPIKLLFYDSLYNEIMKINTGITNLINYKTILHIEENLAKLFKKVNATMEVIEVEGNVDETLHFEGIKKIITAALFNTKLKLEKIKQKKSASYVELNPEKPTVYKENATIKADLQQETLEIMTNTTTERYKVTRQRLLEIESIQENITEQLNLQNERIDETIEKVGEVFTNCKKSKILITTGSNAGHFFRRFLTLLFLCLSFILIFLHLYNKN